MKLPEPNWCYTREQMLQAIRDALEEAAKACENLAGKEWCMANSCADDIRELKEYVK